MPSFTTLRTVLRGSKDTTHSPEPMFACDPFAADGDSFLPAPERPFALDDDFARRPLTPRPDACGHIPAPPTHLRAASGPAPRLISLAEAQRSPDIVYRAVDAPPRVRLPRAPAADWGCAAPLVPLAEAAARADIRYRIEGFEMREPRALGSPYRYYF